MKTTTRTILATALIAVLALTTGCGMIVRRVPRPITEDTRSVPLGAAKSLKADVRMGAGELTLGGGASGALDATFDYSGPGWKPQVDYAVLGEKGRLDVRQPKAVGVGIGSYRNTWDLKLPAAVPTELDVTLGASESSLDLGSLDLRDLDLQLGAGEANIDLSGLASDLDARIEGGVGQLNLTVPRNVGVRIVGLKEGVGEFSADGFSEQDGAYVNDAYAKASTKIEIALRRGVGEVSVTQAD